MKRNSLFSKALAVTFSVALVASMAACGNSSSSTATTAAAAATKAAAAATTAAATTKAAAGGATTAAAAAGGASTAALPDMSGKSLTFLSDKVGSGSYNMIVAMSKVLEEQGKFKEVNVDPSSPGGMGAAYTFTESNVDLAFVNGAPAKWVSETGTLGKGPAQGFGAVIGGLTQVCYISCIRSDFLKKYNISSIEEVFEKKLPLRIGCSQKGSMDAQGAYLLLQYFNVTEDDLKSWGGSITNQGGDQNAEAIADGQIDFYIDHTSSASSTMAQIASTTDVTFLQWGDDLVKWFMDKQGFDKITIPANSFKGQDKELNLPGSPDCLFANSSLDTDTVYAITRVLSENRDDLVKQYAALSGWDPKAAWEEQKRGGVALHPGAEKYYKEMGYMK